MAGSTLGIWVAHGEGRAYFPQRSILAKVEAESLAPVRVITSYSIHYTKLYEFRGARGAMGTRESSPSSPGRRTVMGESYNFV